MGTKMNTKLMKKLQILWKMIVKGDTGLLRHGHGRLRHGHLVEPNVTKKYNILDGKRTLKDVGVVILLHWILNHRMEQVCRNQTAKPVDEMRQKFIQLQMLSNFVIIRSKKGVIMIIMNLSEV